MTRDDSIGSATPEDALKHVVALTMAFVGDTTELVQDLVLDEVAQTQIVSLLQHIAVEVLHPAVAQLEEQLWYSSGRPVLTRTEWPDCACTWVQVWHPLLADESNEPRELLPLPCSRGGQHRLTIVEPGVIDTDEAAAGG